MGEFNPKPSDFRRGARQISASALNQILEATPRVITGDGIEVKRYGDRIVLESDPAFQNQREEFRLFIVVEEFDDIIKCLPFDYDLDTMEYDSAKPTTVLNRGNTGYVYVAKPDHLQKTPYHDHAVLLDRFSVSMRYFDIGKRVAWPIINSTIGFPAPYVCPQKIQCITPRYYPGSIITARASITGYQVSVLRDQDNNPIGVDWLDINEDGRIWDSETGPQVIEIYSTPKQNGYYDCAWKLRDNDTQTWSNQFRVWGLDLNDSASLSVGNRYTNTVYAGLEAGGFYFVSINDNNVDHDLDDAMQWIQTTDDPTTPDDWAAGTYDKGDLVTHNVTTYICVKNTSEEPGASNDWLEVLLINKHGWLDTTVYSKGEYVQEIRPLYAFKSAEDGGPVDPPDGSITVASAFGPPVYTGPNYVFRATHDHVVSGDFSIGPTIAHPTEIVFNQPAAAADCVGTVSLTTQTLGTGLKTFDFGILVLDNKRTDGSDYDGETTFYHDTADIPGSGFRIDVRYVDIFDNINHGIVDLIPCYRNISDDALQDYTRFRLSGSDEVYTDLPRFAIGVLDGVYGLDAVGNSFNGGICTNIAGRISRTLAVFYNDVVQSSAVEGDLYSYTIPANTLSTTDCIEATYSGRAAATSGYVTRIKVYFAGTLIFDSDNKVAAISIAWEVKVTILIIGTGTARCSVTINSSDTTVPDAWVNNRVVYTEVTTLNTTLTNILKITAVADTSSTVTAKFGIISLKVIT